MSDLCSPPVVNNTSQCRAHVVNERRKFQGKPKFRGVFDVDFKQNHICADCFAEALFKTANRSAFDIIDH